MDPITGAALISGGSSLLSGIMGSSSAKSAARSQRAAAKDQIQFARKQFKATDAISQDMYRDQSIDVRGVRAGERERAAPERDLAQGYARGAYADARDGLQAAARSAIGEFRPTQEAGRNALAAYGYNLGLGGRPDGYSGMSMSPGEQYLLETGVNDAFGGAAIRGTLRSGATLAELERRRAGIAAQSRDTQQRELFALGGLGEAANANIANIRTGTAGNIANMRLGLGQDLTRANTVYNDRLNTSGQNYLSNIGNARNNRMTSFTNAATPYQTNALTAMANRGDAGAAGAIGSGNAWANALDTGFGVYGYLQGMQGQQTSPGWQATGGASNPSYQAWRSRFGM